MIKYFPKFINFSLSLSHIQTHIKQCQYEEIECPNHCKSRNVMRLDLDKHLLECPLRIEKCSHCNLDVVSTQLARHHLLVCSKFPVNCPMCGESDIMRENINAHINIITGDCQMVVVPCSFRYIGCMHQEARHKMTKHYQESHTQHLMLLSTRLVDLEAKHRIDLEVCTSRFEQIVGELRQRVEASERQNSELEAQLRRLIIASPPTTANNANKENKLDLTN